ncbi:MAG: hypothetical protein HOM16_16920 [Woeseia sp.]|nr:hypothetical protein [Woeseia sp.]
MQPLAAWLVARPLNGGLGLITALVLPMLSGVTSGLGPVIGGMVMAHLVFANGIRLALFQGVAAAIFLGAFALISNAEAMQVVVTASIIWLPAAASAGLTVYLRSLTLALQVTVILAMVGVLGFFVVLGDPIVFWNDVLMQWTTLVRAGGQSEYADQLLASRALIIPQMTMMAVFTVWTWIVLVLLLGYGLFQSLPGKQALFGRFCDLNFGRVLAAVMALTSVLALASGAAWLQNLAFVVFVVFWLQGLAVMHWLHAGKRLPLFVLLTTYAFLLVPVLNGLIVIALAILGYLDAWFNFRARRTATAA